MKPRRSHRKPTALEHETMAVLADLRRYLHHPAYLPTHPRPSPATLRRRAALLARAQLAVGYRTLPPLRP